MKYILTLTLFILSLYSREVVIYSSGQYHMSDADTKMNARKVALEYAKSNAIEEAGTVIYSEFSIKADSNGNHYSKEDIQSYSAGIIKTKVLNTKIENSTYKVNIEAIVDTSNLEKYQTMSRELKNKLTSIETTNKKLINKLKTLEQKLKQNSQQLNLVINNEKNEIQVKAIETNIKKIVKERNITLTKISKNRKEIVFYLNKGTFSDILNTYKRQLEYSKNNIQKNVFDYYKEQLYIDISKLNATPNDDGTVNITFNVNYWMDKVYIDYILEKYFRFFDGGKRKSTDYKTKYMPAYGEGTINTYGMIEEWIAPEKYLRKKYSIWDVKNTQLSRDLFSWIIKKEFKLKLSINEEFSTEVKLSNIDRINAFPARFRQNRRKGKDNFPIYSKRNLNDYIEFYTTYNKEVTIKNIPEFELENFSKIKVEFIDKENEYIKYTCCYHHSYI